MHGTNSPIPVPHSRDHGGFTLFELMFGIAIAVVAFGLAVPPMQQTLANARRNVAVNALVAAIQFARSESLKSGATVVLCQSKDRSACSEDASFAPGWIVFANTDGDTPPQRDADEPVLRAYDETLPGTVVANRTAFEFRPYPKRSTNGTITFCDATAYAHRLIVSYTGRPRIERVQSGVARC